MHRSDAPQRRLYTVALEEGKDIREQTADVVKDQAWVTFWSPIPKG